MIKSNTFKGFYRIACAVSFALALISSSFTGSAQGAAPDAVPMFPGAAFSQLNSGSSPNRVFTTDLNIFSLDASAKKITIWKKNYVGAQVRQFSGIADITNGVGAKGFTFVTPSGLAKHPTQNIIAITDKGVSAQRVSFYAYTETASEVLFTYLGFYKGEGVVNPTDVAFFPDGAVAVSGSRNNGLESYVLKLMFTGSYSNMSLSGSDLYTKGRGKGTADGLDIDQATGHIFIASASDHCIYEHDGMDIVRTYGVSGTAGSASGYLNTPSDVSVWRGESFAPKVVVADQFNNRVTIFNLSSDNQVFTTIGEFGTDVGQFSKPHSVYADAAEITVADTLNRRVQLFSMDMSNLDSDSITVLGDASYLESSSAFRSATVLLGSTPASNVVLNISGYIPGTVEGAPTVTIPAGTNSAVLVFQTLNGSTNCTLSFAQSTPATYLPTSFSFSILNVAPTLTDATANAYTVSAGGSLELTGVATDPSADVLTYTWTFDDGSSTLIGAIVTNTFMTMGTVTVTLTVSDPDGGFDTATFEIEVGSGIVPTIVFTAIDTESITFKIPTVAKDNSFIVKIAPVLSSNENDWGDWLRISSSNLAIGGSFSETMLMAPFGAVDVMSVDDPDGFTYITVDITAIYPDYTTLFFRVLLDNAGI